MALSESAAAALVKSALLTGDFGGVVTPAAVTLLDTLADAIAKAVGHYASNNTVSTDVSGVIVGGTPATPGTFAGTGDGTIGGMTKGSASANTGMAGEILAELLTGGYGGAITPAARAQLALVADAVAEFVPYVQDNATVATVDIGTAVSPNLNGNTTGDGSGSAV